MCKKEKFLFSLFVFAICTFMANALPGVKQYIADSSGEYVFYKDNSFTRESYIGFLFYNEETYAARYYAPANKEQSLVEKDITIYLTVNKDNSTLEFTGENITGITSNDDADIVNYLHDIFYELTSRRQKITLEGTKSLKIKDEYGQFGGTVHMEYNSLIPFFNLSEIRASDGKSIIEIVTVGALVNSQDQSFLEFKGIKNNNKFNTHTFNKKNAKKIVVEYEGQSIKLDTQWTQTMENLYMLGESAILTLSEISTPPNYPDSDFYAYLIRKITQGTENSYTEWQKMNLSINDSVTKINKSFYQPKDNNILRTFDILTKKENGTYHFVTLSVFDDVYNANKKYFDGILKSYK